MISAKHEKQKLTHCLFSSELHRQREGRMGHLVAPHSGAHRPVHPGGTTRARERQREGPLRVLPPPRHAPPHTRRREPEFHLYLRPCLTLGSHSSPPIRTGSNSRSAVSAITTSSATSATPVLSKPPPDLPLHLSLARSAAVTSSTRSSVRRQITSVKRRSRISRRPWTASVLQHGCKVAIY